MNAVEQWLVRQPWGYGQLEADERQAIRDFAVLWSLFEGMLLGKYASFGKLAALVEALHDAHPVANDRLDEAFAYFSGRYTGGADQDRLFRGLRFAKGWPAEFVLRALRDVDCSAAERTSALLFIVYRLRNNLFHGEKWTDKLRGQRDNFHQANMTMIAVIEAAQERGLAAS